MTIKYVLGFAFADQDEFVLLVRKTRGPSINIGKLNGVGGKVELGEDSMAAMIREFKEETGCTAMWRKIGIFSGDGWCIDLYRGDLGDDEIPDSNDVGEPLQFEEVASVLHPVYHRHYAQNVPTMVAHASLGDGLIVLNV